MGSFISRKRKKRKKSKVVVSPVENYRDNYIKETVETPKKKEKNIICDGDACRIVSDSEYEYEYDSTSDLSTEHLPEPSKETKWVVFGTDTCPYCVKAKKLLKDKYKPNQYEFIDIDSYSNSRNTLRSRTNGYRTIPVIYNYGEFIGGYTEMKKILSK